MNPPKTSPYSAWKEYWKRPNLNVYLKMSILMAQAFSL